jgi:hypothetical protein
MTNEKHRVVLGDYVSHRITPTPPIPKNKKKYPVWVEVTLPLTKPEMLFYSGEKCPTYERGCIACKAWVQWEKTGKLTTVVERRLVIESF